MKPHNVPYPLVIARPSRCPGKPPSFTRSAIVSLCALLVLFAVASCQTSPEPVSGDPDIDTSRMDESVTDDVQESPEPPVEDDPEEEFVVTEEVFVETFQQVEMVIAELNSLIRNREYERWLEYLTEEYRDFYSDPAELALLSTSERLTSAGIVLESLEDFFIHVVVPSRANLRLDDLVFWSETEVEAIMIIREQRVSVYRLRLIDNQWKIEL